MSRPLLPGEGGGKTLEKYAYKEVPGTGDFISL